jgi:hypothetical protein
VYCVTNKTCSKEITQNRPIRICIYKPAWIMPEQVRKKRTTTKGCFACYIIIWSRGWWLCFGNAFWFLGKSCRPLLRMTFRGCRSFMLAKFESLVIDVSFIIR